MCPRQDLAGTHGRPTSPQEEVTVGETQLTRAHSLDSGRKMGKAPTVRVQPPPQIAELNTSTWLIFSLCQMLKHRSMCAGNTDTTAGSGDVLLGNQFAVSAATCVILSRDVERVEADTKAMVLGTEDGDHSSSPKMTFEHISVLEEREPEKAQDKDMEGDETLGAEMDKS